MAPLFWKRDPEVDETQFRKLFAIEGKTVAEFRVRHNIFDIWVEWSFLTEHEKIVEFYHTPKLWEEHYRNWCIPPSFMCTLMKNTREESLSIFYPADHESDRAYVFEINGDYIGQPVYRDFSLKNQTGRLQLFEENTIGTFFARSQIDLYSLTRLLIPTNNVILF